MLDEDRSSGPEDIERVVLSVLSCQPWLAKRQHGDPEVTPEATLAIVGGLLGLRERVVSDDSRCYPNADRVLVLRDIKTSKKVGDFRSGYGGAEVET